MKSAARAMAALLLMGWLLAAAGAKPNGARILVAKPGGHQPLGIAMQEFDDKDACEAQAKRLASPYLDVKCAPKSSGPSFSQR